ncbi:MAG TPA: glutathione S-transferase [Burkholderiaceae bacterium]
MYTLYGYRGSGSAMVEAALLLAGQPFRQIDAAEWDAASALAELRALNPLAQIPTLLLPDGAVLSESAAILIHLGLTHPDSGLLPTDATGRAQALRGLVYIAANCYAAIGVIDYPQRFCDEPDEALRRRIIATTRKRLHGLWDDFADSFGAGLKTEPPDALALMACVVSRWSGTRPHLAAARPALHAALLRIEQHAAVAPVFARHWPVS